MSAVERVCSHCGVPYPVTEDVCPRCGQPADRAPSLPAQRQLPAIIARAAVPVALGIAGVAARAGLIILRSLVRKALSPAPEPSSPPATRPRVTVHFWQRKEVRDTLGRRAWEETRARWDIRSE